MRWLLLAFCSYGAVCAVLSATVTDGKPYVKILARSSVYNVGENKAIYCEGHNLPQKLNWYTPTNELVKERSNMVNRIFVERNKDESLESCHLPLFLEKLEITDSGNWTCRAGKDLEKTTEIFVGKKVQMDVKEETIIGHEGKAAKFICEADGFPEPVVQWFKDNSVIEADQKRIFIHKRREHTHVLEIKDLTHLDPGTYMCRVTQEKLTYFTDKSFQLIVNHQPVITNGNWENVVEVFAIINEIKNITCNAIAYPPPTFTWTKKNKDDYHQLITGDETVYTAEDNTYSVLMLRVNDEDDLGEYKCSVKNTMGQKQIVFDVTVGNKPDPPTSVQVVEIQAHNITFNVSCSTCLFTQEEGQAQRADNLTVLGFTFQLVPCREGVAVPNWRNATEYDFDVTNTTELLFTVEPLLNGTEYHVQVATRNAAGLSDWLPVHPNPKTKDAAAALTTSLSLLIITFIATRCY